MWKNAAEPITVGTTVGGSEPLEYRLLGPVAAFRGNESLDLGGYKQRALFALLLINANEVVSTDRIIDELWGESAGKDRQNALWVGVSRLRSALEPDREKRSDGTILVTRQPGYMLSVDSDNVDANRFEALAREGRALLETDPGAGALVLNEALGLWRGHALEEFTYEPFATAEVGRLEEMRLAAVEDRVDADLRTGRAGELVGELEGLVRQHPLRERMAGQLMLALHLSGRQGDALRAFGALRARLVEELGLEPSAELSKLEERILLDDPELRQTQAVRALAGRPEPGLSVRGYELRDKVGEGSIGSVYRAFQPAVGREVAIKVIRPELANDPNFIRRFETEAQAIAHLEHPQIVPVYDYWREPDSAFVVMRRFGHGSLRDAIADGPLTTSAAVRVLAQIGGALAAGHRRGVIHGNLKPENVLLDGDGNAFVADFGMSGLTYGLVGAGDRTTGHVGGSAGGEVEGLGGVGADQGFAAPEQRATGEATVRSDVYSFGALVEVALRGSVGDGDAPDSPLVGPVAQLVSQAMAENPADRFPDIDSFVGAMATAFGEPAVDDVELDVELTNPYRGLRAFSEEDASQFFGRERLVERLVVRVGHSGPQGRFVALVGPSGSGKSSVIRAGVLPALREAAIPGSDRWFTVTMTPGRHPFEALEDALRGIAVHPPANLLEQLTTNGIASAVDSLTADPSAQIVIVVDQLEELFSHTTVDDANAFLAALADVADDRHSKVKVIATLRADFYDHPLRHVSFGELLRLGTEVITPMNPQELERAITGPAADVGVSFEPGLVALISSDMVGQATALPLMQYALTELFEQRTGTTVTADAYRTMGGVPAALARRADALYTGLGDHERAVTREVFLRLVTINEGSADTRRRALLSEINAVAGESASVVLDTFGRHRLLSFDRDPITRGPTVEIAHEALLTEWARLSHWIDDARSDVQSQRRLAIAASEWRDHDQGSDYVLAGAQLARYDGWLERAPVRLTTQELNYLAASKGESEADLAAEQRRVKRLRRLVAGVGVALVVALIAGGIAVAQQRRADDEARRAEAAAAEAQAQTDVALEEGQRADDEAQRAGDEAARAEAAASDALAQTEVAVAAAQAAELATLISRSAAAGDDDPELALLLALEAHERSPGSDTEQAVLSALARPAIGQRIVSRQPLVDDCFGGSFFPQWTIGGVGILELAQVDGRMLARNPVSGDVIDSGPPPQDCSVGASTGVVGLAGPIDQSRILTGPNFDVQLDSVPGASIVTATDERVVVSSTLGIQVFDAATGRLVGSPIEEQDAIAAATNEDGSLIAVSVIFGDGRAVDGQVIVLDAATAQPIAEFDANNASPLAFDDATGNLLVALFGGGILTVDPRTGETIASLTTETVTNYIAIGMSGDGQLTLVARNGIDVVDPATGAVSTHLDLQNVGQAFVRPDGLVVAVGASGQIDVFDADGSGLIEEMWDFDPTRVAAFGSRRAAVASAFSDRSDVVELIELDTGERSTVMLRSSDGQPFPAAVAFPEPDGFWAISFPGHVLARWEGDRLVDELFLGSAPDVTNEGWYEGGRRFGDYVAAIGRRSDGTNELSLIRAGRDGSDVGERAEIAFTIETEFDLINPDNELGMAHPTPDGGVYVVDEVGTLRTYDPTGALVSAIETPVTSPVAIALDPTGSILAIGSLDGVLVVMDTADGTVVTVPGPAVASELGFNGDGSILIISTFGGEVRLYDVEQGGTPATVWRGAGTFASEPGWYDAENDTMWMTASGRLLEIPVDPARWVERGCAVLDRELSQEEWDRYVPGDEPLRSVCG